MSGILALDLARVTGWAYASEETLKVWPATRMHGTYPLAFYGRLTLEAYNPQLWTGLADWLADRITEWEPGLVVFEGPVIFPKAQPMQLRRAMGSAAVVELVCWRRAVTCREVPPATIKKHWTGSGRAKKAQMVAEARARGFAPQDDNVADALALLDYSAHSLGYPVMEAA